jgi:hypothetical protein
MDNKNKVVQNKGLNFRIGRSQIFFSSLSKDVSHDVNLFPAQRDGAGRVRLEQDADRVEGHLELRAQTNEHAAHLKLM